MIIWINGPYGIGKSTLAEEISKRIQPSFIFDAEKVGDAVRDNFPQQFFKETFEEFPLWHEMCYKLLKKLDEVYPGCVLVPMTLTRLESCTSIIERLKCDGVDVWHIMLEADYEAIRERILARGEEEDCWCIQQIESCLEKQKAFSCDCRICSSEKGVQTIAEEIMHFVLLKNSH